MNYIKIFALFLFVFLPSAAWAQLQARLSTSTGYSSNAYANAFGSPDKTSRLYGSVSHGWFSDHGGVKIAYLGSLLYFQNTMERTNHQHGLAADFYSDIDKIRSQMNIGLFISANRYSESYDWYNQYAFSGHMDMKTFFSPHLYGYIGLGIERQNYQILDLFSNTRISSYIRLSRFFESGTSVITELDFYQKNIKPESGIALPPEIPQVITLGNNQSQQLTALLRVAQSVTPSIGLAAEGLMRKNISNSVRYLQSLSGAYYSDEMLFDDIFGYNSWEYMLNLKTRHTKKRKTQTAIRWIDKN